MRNLDQAVVGQRVCLVGYGTAAILHSHKFKVDRITKTLVVVADPEGHERRFRRDDGYSVPYGTWGGTTADITCQKPTTTKEQS